MTVTEPLNFICVLKVKVAALIDTPAPSGIEVDAGIVMVNEPARFGRDGFEPIEPDKVLVSALNGIVVASEVLANRVKVPVPTMAIVKLRFDEPLIETEMVPAVPRASSAEIVIDELEVERVPVMLLMLRPLKGVSVVGELKVMVHEPE